MAARPTRDRLRTSSTAASRPHRGRRARTRRPTPPHNETVVTAPALIATAPREDRSAAATVLVPRESPRAADDLGSLLLEVPGANVTRTGGVGAFSTLSLRGSNPDEVRVFVDGIPLNQAVGGAVDLSTLPLGDVERIEVYRGSAPIVFGESALGGIVSITTRTPGEAQATARLGGGSFGTMYAGATGGGALGPLRLYLGLHALRAHNDFPIDVARRAGRLPAGRPRERRRLATRRRGARGPRAPGPSRAARGLHRRHARSGSRAAGRLPRDLCARLDGPPPRPPRLRVA